MKRLFDDAVADANNWLHDIGEHMGTDDPQLAYHALRGVLHAIRDRFPVDEATSFAAQLPMLIRGIYYEGYRSAHKPERMKEEHEIYHRVRREINAVGGSDAEAATEAVLSVLNSRITAGELEDAQATFPEQLKGMFPEFGEQQAQPRH